MSVNGEEPRSAFDTDSDTSFESDFSNEQNYTVSPEDLEPKEFNSAFDEFFNNATLDELAERFNLSLPAIFDQVKVLPRPRSLGDFGPNGEELTIGDITDELWESAGALRLAMEADVNLYEDDTIPREFHERYVEFCRRNQATFLPITIERRRYQDWFVNLLDMMGRWGDEYLGEDSVWHSSHAPTSDEETWD